MGQLVTEVAQLPRTRVKDRQTKFREHEVLCRCSEIISALKCVYFKSRAITKHHFSFAVHWG